MKEESEKAGLKLNIQKLRPERKTETEDHGIWSHHFIASRWGTMKTVTDFILGGSKITAVITTMKLQDTCSLKEKL